MVKAGLTKNEMIDQGNSFCFINGNVVTYNDEISVSCPVKDLEIEGAINSDELYSFISKVKKDVIEMDVTDSEIIFKSGRAKVGLRLQNEIILPVQEIGKISKWKTLPGDFLKGLSFTMAACSRNSAKPIITCVHVNGSTHSMEGTDSYRVSPFALSENIEVD